MKHLFTLIWGLGLISMITNAQTFDGDKPEANLVSTYSENFEAWDANKFYGQWNLTEPSAFGGFGQNDFVTNGEGEGYLDFVWPAKRIMTSHIQYSAPYAVETDLEFPIPEGEEPGFYLSNRGGLVIRALPVFPDDIQEPGEIALWNKVGIAFFPEDEGNSMVIQISGEVKEDGTTAQTRINVPKPEGTETLWGRSTLKIEDFGQTIYAYLGGQPFFRIDFAGKEGRTYTSGAVYDSEMQEVGTFENMPVGEAGKISVGMRDAFLNLYNVAIWQDADDSDPQAFDSDKPQVDYDNHYSDDFSSWNETDFYDQWSALNPEAFTGEDITGDGALAFVWADKRIIASNTVYSQPYILEAEINYGNPSNRGGVVIRTNPEAVDNVQDPANGDPGFNKAGIAFYPTLDGQYMIVQFTGTALANGVTDQTQVLVPKPEGVSSLLEKGTLKIEDTGLNIYVYYNDSPFIRIDLDEKDGDVLTSGILYNSEMEKVGIFYNKVVDKIGRIFIGQRDAALELYSVSVWDNETVTSINDASANAVNIFPNPVVSDVNVSSSSPIKAVSIADISGKVVYKTSGLDKTQMVLNVNDYQPGIYIVRLVTEKGINVHKFVIRR